MTYGAANTFSPRPYQSPSNPGFHRGIVTVSSGSATVDLGIGHNNFIVSPSFKGDQGDLEVSPNIAWAYGTKPGTFVLAVSKLDIAGTDTDPATVDIDVAFIAIADASV